MLWTRSPKPLAACTISASISIIQPIELWRAEHDVGSQPRSHADAGGSVCLWVSARPSVPSRTMVTSSALGLEAAVGPMLI